MGFPLKRLRSAGFGSSLVLSGALLTSVMMSAGCSDVITYSKDFTNNGIKLYNQGEYADAAGSFRSATRQDPRRYEAWYYMGASYDQLKSHGQAIQAYKTGLDVMQTTVTGRQDLEYRAKLLDALAASIAADSDRQGHIDMLVNDARKTQKSEDYLVLAKIFRTTGDADTSLDYYQSAALLDRDNVLVQKEYGLYLEQLGQARRAETPLRRAYALNPEDEQVSSALRRIGVVPGPSLKDEGELISPLVPRGPLPELKLPTIGNGAAPEQPRD